MQSTETITYRGVQVQAVVVGLVNDDKRDSNMLATLLRDATGRYYLRREFSQADDGLTSLSYARNHPEEDLDYRCLVHAVSLNAAIVWAVRNTPNSDSRALYLDASNLLTEGRSVDDPPPFPYMSWEEWRASDEFKALDDEDMAGVPEGGCLVTVRPGDGGGMFSVPLDADEREALEERARVEGTSVGEAFLSMLRRRLGVTAPAPVYDLEPKVRKLLARYCRLRPAEDPRDVVNAGLACWLESSLESVKGSGEAGRDADVATARRRRLRRGDDKGTRTAERAVQSTEPAKAGTHPNAVAPPGYKRVFGLYPLEGGSRFGFLEVEDDIFEHFKRRADASGLSVGEEIAAHMEAKGSQAVRVPVLTQAQLSERGRAQMTESTPTAVHGLNAAAPEAVCDESTARRHGDAVPVRDLLADLAAEWRIKAAEARATGQDATPYPASHKLHGQADLLEACADRIEAIANGKGGN